ncbi:TIGR03757 family integrating conjugative element protein [Azotobacter salinestris]|uniref:TIGR03757 family integrating conjugative element protein n=1 Tax=Azotobacter salinestris TaxID=69964 RepID=UPI0032DF50A3
MPYPRLSILVLTWSFIPLLAQAETWIVTDSQHPVTHFPKGARLILLDEPERLEDKLTALLPKSPALAQRVFNQRLAANRPLADQLSQSLQGVAAAWSVGVRKVPAVVVERRFVVYGEPDVRQALMLIDRHK